jgi:hypothetical protein
MSWSHIGSFFYSALDTPGPMSGGWQDFGLDLSAYAGDALLLEVTNIDLQYQGGLPAWNSGTNYVPGDVVYDGSSGDGIYIYYCIVANHNFIPHNNPTYWQGPGTATPIGGNQLLLAQWSSTTGTLTAIPESPSFSLIEFSSGLYTEAGNYYTSFGAAPAAPPVGAVDLFFQQPAGYTWLTEVYFSVGMYFQPAPTPPPFVLWQHGANFSGFQPSNEELLPQFYCRYGGILKDESNIWAPSQGANNGTNLGLNAVRDYCMANDIWVSGWRDSQDSAAKILQDLCEIANCAPVWDGTGLDFIPYSEVSAYDNGTVFTPYTATGPIFEFDRSDYFPKSGDPPITKTHQRPDRNYNSLKIDFVDAYQQYGNNEVIISDAADITVQGALPGNAKNYTNLINSAEIAAAVGWAQLKRDIIVGRESFSFRLHRLWAAILTPMDLIVLTDDPPSGPPLSPWMMPARITKITEDLEGDAINVECEPFVYGASSPAGVPAGVIS